MRGRLSRLYDALETGQFSRDDLPTIIRSNLSQSEVNSGHVGNSLAAPGHYYCWQYPKVKSEISEFMEKNFDLKR